MKKIISISILLLVVFSSCKKSTLEAGEGATTDLVPAEVIDAFIKQGIERDKKFEWGTASAEMVWSAAQHADKIMSVGYQPAAAVNVDNSLHLININDAAWKTAREQVLQMILLSEQQLDKSISLAEIVQWEENVLPVVDIMIKNPATVKLLRASNLIRYVEPMGYEPRDAVLSAQQEANYNNAVASSSGCGSNTATAGLIENADYTTITPGTKQSWNYGFHNIPQAWTKTTGAGTKVFIIDTGCEFDQENLGSAFNQGTSTGRTVEKIVTLPRSTFLGIPTGPVETADDGCGMVLLWPVPVPHLVALTEIPVVLHTTATSLPAGQGKMYLLNQAVKPKVFPMPLPMPPTGPM